jgi:hypothetical protein
MTDNPTHDLARVLRCVRMAMGCISPTSRDPDERLAWYRLLDAVEGREPRPPPPLPSVPFRKC